MEFVRIRIINGWYIRTVKLSLEVYWGMEVQLHPFFDLCTRRR
jgi:hypothetical protein